MTKSLSQEELFQNRTVRPILKTKNDLFIIVFIDYSIKQKNTYFDRPINDKMIYIEHVIQDDIVLRNTLKGIVIALFTIQEYKEYILNTSNFNKRISNMLTERLKSEIILLDNKNIIL